MFRVLADLVFPESNLPSRLHMPPIFALRGSFLFGLSMLGAVIVPSPLQAVNESTDVLIYGATPAGIAAAVAAAKGGQSVMLVEPTARIGGMITNGLSYADCRSFESLSGCFLDFTRRVEADYRTRDGSASGQVASSFRGAHAEPAVNLRVFEQMLAEYPRLRVMKRLALARGSRLELSGKFSFADLTTRRHYPGRHRIYLLVNGVTHPLAEFEVRA